MTEEKFLEYFWAGQRYLRNPEEVVRTISDLTKNVRGLDTVFDILDLYPIFNKDSNYGLMELRQGNVKVGNPVFETSTLLEHLIVSPLDQTAVFLFGISYGHCNGGDSAKVVGFYNGNFQKSGFQNFGYGRKEKYYPFRLIDVSPVEKLENFQILENKARVSVRYTSDCTKFLKNLEFDFDSGKINVTEEKK